jgi:hypothetical protein
MPAVGQEQLHAKYSSSYSDRRRSRIRFAVLRDHCISRREPRGLRMGRVVGSGGQRVPTDRLGAAEGLHARLVGSDNQRLPAAGGTAAPAVRLKF